MKDWYNWTLSVDKMNEFLGKYKEYDFELFSNIAKSGDLEEFRLLCNALDKDGYVKSYFRDNYKDVSELKKLCNERVSEILGNLLPVFNTFRTSQKHEFWGGDERYKLFGFDFPPYAERKIIKSTLVFFIKYLNRPLEFKELANITHLYNHGLYWDLIKEPSTTNVDWENDENEFNRLNESRKEHIKAWTEFMDIIWRNDFDKAYSFMYDLAVKYNEELGWDYI